MTNFFKKWRQFIKEEPSKPTGELQLLNEERLDGTLMLNEISQERAEKVMAILYNNTDTDKSLSFSKLFGGANRASEPMKTQQEGPVGDIITLFENFGFDVDLAEGTISRTDTINYEEIAMNIFNGMFKNRSSDSLRSKVKVLADTYTEGPYAMDSKRIANMFFNTQNSDYSFPELLADPAAFEQSGMEGRNVVWKLKQGRSRENAAHTYVPMLRDSIKRAVNDSSISKANMKRTIDDRPRTGPEASRDYALEWTHPEIGDLRTELFAQEDLEEVMNIMLAVADKAPKPGTKKTTKLKIGKALEKIHNFADKIEQLLDRARANPGEASPEELAVMPGQVWDPDLASHNFQEIRFLKDADWFGEARAILKQLSNLLPYSDGFPSQGLIEKGKESEWIQKDLLGFWNRKSQFYRENPEEAYGSPYTIIFSRHPMDVVRMSDFAAISSCHSETGNYFHCAIAEAKGHGPIAYVVRTDQLEAELERNGVENINELDDEEIFNDPQRGVRGIEPISRLRLRKLVNIAKDYELAVPENRVYGKRFPGFMEAVQGWAREQQIDRFRDPEDPDRLLFPDKNEFVMHGGSYTDTSGGKMLKNFFEPYLKPGDDVTYTYHGSVRWEGAENEMEDNTMQELYEEWVHACGNLQDNADYQLEYSEVEHYVEADAGFDGEPSVGFSGKILMEFKDVQRGFDYQEDVPPSARQFAGPNEKQEVEKDIEEILDSQHSVHPDDINIRVATHIEHVARQLQDVLGEEVQDRSFAASFNEPQRVDSYNQDFGIPEPEGPPTVPKEVKRFYIEGPYEYAGGNYANTPEGFSDFIDYMKEQDANMAAAKESVRKYLKGKGFLAKTEIDKYAEEFQDETEAFKNFDWDYDEGYLTVNTKPPGLYLGVINPDLDTISDFWMDGTFQTARKKLYDEYGGDILFGPGFQGAIESGLREVIAAAQKEARRQLELDLDDEKEATSDWGSSPSGNEYMSFKHADVKIHTDKKAEGYEHIYDAHLSITFKFSTKTPKEELKAAIEFIKVLDHQYIPQITDVAQTLLARMQNKHKEVMAETNEKSQDISSKSVEELVAFAINLEDEETRRGRIRQWGIQPNLEKNVNIERELRVPAHGGRRSFSPKFWAELATTQEDTIIVNVMSRTTNQWVGEEVPVTPLAQAYAAQMLRFIYASMQHGISVQDFSETLGFKFEKDVLESETGRSWKTTYGRIEESTIRNIIKVLISEKLRREN